MADGDGGSTLQQWLNQSKNPAAPKGAQAGAQQAAGVAAGDPSYSGSVLGQWLNEGGYNANSTSWYTGANPDGTGNGWDTGFRAEAFKQYDETLKQFEQNPNAFNDWLKRDDATGVVSWGSRDGAGTPDDPKFGDVYNAGKKVGNIYEDYQRPEDANLMIADWMLDAKTKRKVFADPDRDRWLADEIEKNRASATDSLTKGVRAREFQADVDAEQKKLQEGSGNEWLIAGAAGAGGLLAGGAAFFTGGATAPLAVAGFTAAGAALAGGAAALNQDQLTELSARAIVQSRMADEEFGGFQGFTTGLSGWSQVGMKLISPISNTVQGIGDAKFGKIGDTEESFYAIDENGKRKAPAWLQIADVAGTLGDSLLQFSNPVGLGMYSATMAGSITGDIGTLATTGESFDMRSGDFRDHEGFKENAAAWMNVGIDAVQLGMAHGLTNAARSARTLFGGGEAAAAETAPGLLARSKAGLQEKLPAWAGGLQPGQKSVSLMGSRYVVDEATGAAVSRHFSLASLAPSELNMRTAVGIKTRVTGARRAATEAAARTDMKLTADDYFRTAQTLASGQTSKLGLALLNGFGEGVEEAAQGILEPISNDAPINVREVAQQFFYGAAAGLGMGLATSIHAPSQSQKLYSRALNKGLLTGEMMSQEQFDALPKDRQLALANMSEDEVAQTKVARDAIAKALNIGTLETGTMGRYALSTGLSSEFERQAAKANSNITSILKILPFNNGDVTDAAGNLGPNSAPSYSAELSGWRAVEEIRKNVRALATHVTSLQRDLAEAQAAINSGSLDEAGLAENTGRVQELTVQLADAEQAHDVGQLFLSKMMDSYEQLAAAPDLATSSQIIDAMNQEFLGAYFGQTRFDGQAMTEDQARGLRSAVSVLYSRDPNIEDGSFLQLVPRINKALHFDQAHGVIQVHQSLISAPNADHDGDNFRAARNLMLDRKSLNRLRTGEQYLSYSEEDGARRVTVRIAAPDADPAMLALVAKAFTHSDPAVRSAARQHVDALKAILWTQYGGFVADVPRFNRILDTLATDIEKGAPAARNTFLDALATAEANGIQGVAADLGYAQWPWISQQITAKLDAIQQAYASNQPEFEYTPGEVPGSVTDSVPKAYIQEVNLAEASNYGTTLQLVRSGTSDVRGAQALHYTAYRALTEALVAKDTLAPDLMRNLVEFYEGRSGGIAQSSMEDMLNRNSTVRRVLSDLQSILDESGVDYGKHSHAALMLLSMTRVQDFDFTDEGPALVNRDITLLQFLLRRSVRIDRAAIDKVADRNEDVVRKLDMLERMTFPRNNDGGHSTAAQEAAFEVFADIPMYQLIGDSSMYLGMQRTLRDLRSDFLDMDRATRANRFSVLTRKAPYLGRSKRSNPPYDASETEGGKLHPYRAAVDMLEAVVNKAAPRRAEQSTRVMDQFETGIAQLQKSLEDFAGLLTGADKAAFDALATQRERVLFMVNSNANLARVVAEVFPQAVQLGAFRVDELGRAYAAEWVTEMLEMKPAEALMHYWRNTVLTEYLAAGTDIETAAEKIKDQVDSDLDDAKAGRKTPRAYAKLQTGSARLIYRAAAQQDTVMLQQLLREMANAKDLRTFTRDVLNTPLYLGNHAPITPFVDDVAEFDTSNERRWQPNFPGAQQREAIAKFAESAARYSTALAHAAAVRDSDTQIAGKIEAYVRAQFGDNVAVSDDAKYLTAQLALAVENAQEFWTSVGPNTREVATAALQMGMPVRHNKGAADPALAPLGEARVLAEGGGSKVSMNRALADMTAYSEKDVLANPSLLASRSMRIQLDNGAIIDWVAPDVTDVPVDAHNPTRPRADLLAYAQLLKDPATSGFVKEVLGLTVKERGLGTGLQTAFYADGDPAQRHSLERLLNRSNFAHLFPGPQGSLTTAQAHELISLIEGGVFKEVYGEGAEAETAGFYPLQQMIDEVNAAQTHSLAGKLRGKKASDMREASYRDVAYATLLLADQHSQSPLRVKAVVEMVKQELRKRYGSAAPSIMDGARTFDQRVTLLLETARARMDAALRQQDRLTAEFQAATVPADRDRIAAQMRRVAEEIESYTENLENNLSDSSVDQVLAMFTISNDPETAAIQKHAILDYLGAGRLSHFTEDEAEVWALVRDTLTSSEYLSTGVDDLPAEVWPTLSRAAATVFLSERARQTGTSVSLKLIEPGAGAWNDVSRYFDHTWSFLLDHAAKTPVLETTSKLARRAGYTTHLSVEETAKELLRTLFSPKKLGAWSEAVVKQNHANKEALLSSGVGMAVAIPGDLPTVMATTTTALSRSYDVPTEPPTTRELTPNELLDPKVAARLNNRFVLRNGGAVLNFTDETGQPATYDLFTDSQLGQQWGDPEDEQQSKVFNSGYVLVSYERLMTAIERGLADAGGTRPISDWTLSLTMFDPEQRPFGPEWTHNVFYSGIAREGERGTRDSIVAEAYFSADGIYHTLVQAPLDALKKGQAAFTPTPHIDLDVARSIETNGQGIYAQLEAKAQVLLDKEYDFGHLQSGDFNMLMELLRSRHMVRGTNASGQVEIWSVDRAVAAQRPDPAEAPLTDMQLVPLSEELANKLFGEATGRGSSLAPSLDQRAINRFTIFDAGSLRAAGIDKLGQPADFRDTAFRHRLPLATVSGAHPDASVGIDRYEARTHRLRTNLAQMLARRSQVTGTGPGRFDVDRMAATAQTYLKDALSGEAVAAKMAQAGLSQFGPPTESQDAMTQRVMNDIMARTEGGTGNTYFLHRWGVSPDPAAGVLTEESFSQGDSPFLPALEDHVFLDLASIERLGLSDTKTLDRAKQVFAFYADRGATIHLINGSGARKLREDLRLYGLSDQLGYTSLSSHTLVPILSDTERSQTARAMERTLIETREVSRDRLRWEFRSNQFVQANENASHWNQTDDPATWPIMRANILAQRPGGFGRPQTSEQRELVRQRLLDLFDAPGGLDHLVKMAGEGDGIRESLTKLQSQLASGQWPTSVGQQFGFGYFDVLVGPNDTVYLSRQGMESLTAREAHAQAAIPVGATAPDPGVPGSGVAVGPSKRDEALTSNVGEVVRVEPSQFGGGEQVLMRINVGTTGAKLLGDLDGMKHGIIPMPEGLAFPGVPLAAGQPISLGSGIVAGRSKEALFGTVTNFRNAFLGLGADFRADMIEFVTGAKPTRDNFDEQWALTETVLQAIAKADFNVDASDIAAALRSESFFLNYGTLLSEHLTRELGIDGNLSQWLQTSDRTEKPVERLATVLIASLLVPEVKLEHVIATQGVNDIRLLGSSDRAQLMPQVFTDALDDYRYPQLREMLFDRLNAKLPPAAADGVRDYTLQPDWTFVVRMMRNGVPEFFTGELKLTDIQLDDAHPDLQVQSEATSTQAGVSLHGAAQASVLFSGSIAHERDFEDRLVPDARGDGERLFSLLTDIAGDDLPELDKTPSERLWVAAGRRRHALYLQGIDKTEFTDPGREKYTRWSRQLAQLMFDDEAYIDEVDYLVRLSLGARGIDPEADGEYEGVDRVPEDQALESLAILLENAQQGYFPLYGTTIPLVDGQFMRNLFEANKNRAKPWAPLVQTGRGTVTAKMDLASWVDAAIGQMLESEASFDSAFRLDLDGVFQTYDDMLPELKDLPPSTSPLIAMKLYDPQVQELAASADPNTRVILDQIIAPSGQRMTMESFLLGEAEYSRDTASLTSGSATSRRLSRIQEWHAKNRTGPQKPGKVRDYLKEGAWYSKRAQSTHRFLNMLTNLRLGMAMFNPALMIAAVPEAQARNALDNAVSLLTGTSVSTTGRAIAKLGEAVGVETRYSTEELERINNLISVLGNDPRFMSMIYDELMYAHHIEPGESRTAAALEKFARLGSRMQDPTWGMFAKSVAKRYVETALAYIEFDPSENVTLDAFVSMMNNNPRWLHDISPRGSDTSPLRGLSAHSAALNAVAQVRSTRANIAGKAIRGVYEPLTHNPNAAISFAGHLIKWPLIFSNYTMGAAMFVTGTGGIGDFVAAQLHGRNSAFFGRLQAFMRGQPYNEATDSTFDMSDVLEGLDLTRSFLRAGITWSGYMAYLLAGGVGLSGEDDEARRRRLLAQYYGAPLQYDPLAVQNDFRSADMVFLDALPGPLQSIAKVFSREDGEHPGQARSVLMPHWMIRQFVSPLVGMERFMNTGDIRQIKWGFQDAISTLPLSVTRTVGDAIAAADELSRMAENEAQIGTAESMTKTNRLIIGVVGIYERMMLESSFVNTIRNGSDRYDRMPWAIPKTDAQGNIVRDNMGNPEYTDALSTFRDPETDEVRQGYASRDYWDAQWHQYAENNATFAMAMSIFTGRLGNSDYLRRNMPVKQVNVPLKQQTDDQAKSLAVQMMNATGKTTPLTESEAVNLLRNQIHEATGQWKSTAELAPYAMSVIKEKQEQLTKQGARTIIESIYAGSADMGAPSLEGIFITGEQRREIQKDIIEDLVNEGLEWGMDDVSAKSRANRIWWGHNTDAPNQIGLRDLVWSKDIASKPTAAYNQLNTAYVMGPGGRPYAVGAARESWFEALGLNPLGKGMTLNTKGGLNIDGRFNTTDNVIGINTGLRALERNEAESLTPDDEAAKKVLGQKYQKPSSNGYSRYGGYRRGGSYRRRSGGGYSGGGGGFANFEKMYRLPDSKAPYGDSIPFINTSNPIIRRADVRRERVWSERGRLKQWQ